jgi:Ca2+-binding EF-hand superfamily protein
MSFLAAMLPISAAAKVASGLFARRSNSPTSSEFQQVLQQTLGTRVVGRYDTDGDGALARSEFRGDGALFDLWDANSDGLLSAGEIDAGAKLLRQFRLLDSDADSQLTRHEFGASPDAFSAIDADGDRRISRGEFFRSYGGGTHS